MPPGFANRSHHLAEITACHPLLKLRHNLLPQLAGQLLQLRVALAAAHSPIRHAHRRRHASSWPTRSALDGEILCCADGIDAAVVASRRDVFDGNSPTHGHRGAFQGRDPPHLVQDLFCLVGVRDHGVTVQAIDGVLIAAVAEGKVRDVQERHRFGRLLPGHVASSRIARVGRVAARLPLHPIRRRRSGIRGRSLRIIARHHSAGISAWRRRGTAGGRATWGIAAACRRAGRHHRGRTAAGWRGARRLATLAAACHHLLLVGGWIHGGTPAAAGRHAARTLHAGRHASRTLCTGGHAARALHARRHAS
jgi:hypothetical protein